MTHLSVPTPDGEMAVYLAEPTAPNGRAVIVIQEAFGVTGHITSVADRCAAEGYLALAPHLFHRTGDPVIDYGDVASAMAEMAAVTRRGLDDDLDATTAAAVARGIPARRTGVIGFCLGGTVALYAATRTGIGAAVGFYGGGIVNGRLGLPPLVDLAPRVAVPFLGQYGDEDRGIPVAQVEALRAALAAAPAPTGIVRYPGAGHAFHRDGWPASYHAPSARAAWARAVEWFGRYLDGPAP